MNELFALLGLQPIDYPKAEPTTADISFSPIRSALENMTEKERETFLTKLLKNLELTGEYQESGDKYVTEKTYGGRIGYNLPIDQSSAVRAGMSGGGYNVQTPIGTFKGSELTSGDIGYKFGPNDISLAYTSQGALPLTQIPMQTFERNQFDPTAAQRIKDFWQLLYRRQF